MVNFKLDDTRRELTIDEQLLLQSAKGLPEVYDEDSPALSEDMEQAFCAARQAKPYGEAITMYVSSDTAEKIRSIGDNYGVVIGDFFEKVMKNYPSVDS